MFEIKIQAKPLQQMLAKFPRRFVRELATAANRAGALLHSAGVSAFENDDFGWTPLSAAYLAWKEKLGYDSRILVRSHLMMYALRFRRQGLGGKVFIPAGMTYPEDLARLKPSRSGAYREGRTFTWQERLKVNTRIARRLARSGSYRHRFLSFIMRTHEDGDGVPRRPLFEPLVQFHVKEVVEQYSAALSRAVGESQYPTSWDTV